MESMQLGGLKDETLVSQLREACLAGHRLVAKIVAYLAEIDHRELHLELGSTSLYDFCVEKLGMSEGVAFRRINAARLVRIYPELLPRIASGALHLSGLVLLRDHFTRDNVEELADAASGLSKAKLLELIAARAPRPDVPDRVSPIPPRQEQIPITGSPPAPTERPAARSRTEPLSSDTYLVQLTVSADTHAKLVQARDLLRHCHPDGNLAAVVDRALDALIEQLRKRQFGSDKGSSRKTSAGTKTGAVSRAARREVFERDGEQCTFRSKTGERCSAKVFLQADHVLARALGGSGEASNLQVLCGSHNRLKARKELGVTRVQSKIARRGRKAPTLMASVAPAGSVEEVGSPASMTDDVPVPVAPAPRAFDNVPQTAAAIAKQSAFAGGGRGSPAVALAEPSSDEAKAIFGLADMGFPRHACERVVRGILEREESGIDLVSLLRKAIGTLASTH